MKAYPISMEIAGNTAMWTRPDTGDCPVSYPAPTYSAVRNIFQSVLWGEAIKIIPAQVDICNPLQYHTYYTNYGGPLRKSSSILKDQKLRFPGASPFTSLLRLYSINTLIIYGTQSRRYKIIHFAANRFKDAVKATPTLAYLAAVGIPYVTYLYCFLDCQDCPNEKYL